MRRALLIVLILTLSATAADARRRHHRGFYGAPVMMIAPEVERAARGRGESTQFVPADWQLQPADPSFNGRRYIAPDGAAWLALYSAPVEKDAIAAHLKSVAFADGEDVTYLRGARDWLAVSGLKADRVYYRKVALACGGATWRHIAFEYPVAAKPVLDRLVERAAGIFDRLAEHSCAGDLFTHPKG